LILYRCFWRHRWIGINSSWTNQNCSWKRSQRYCSSLIPTLPESDHTAVTLFYFDT